VTKRYPKRHKAKNPNPDATIIYETGGRDIENPYSGDSLKVLEEESEGSWEVDVRNAGRLDDGGYPDDDEGELDHEEDIRRYPSYYSKKGAPRGRGYPTEEEWWQKALSFVARVRDRYTIVSEARRISVSSKRGKWKSTNNSSDVVSDID